MNPPAIDHGLVVVHARDEVNSTLAGHDGCEYTSPPQARGDALALVALLLGHPTQPDRDHDTVPGRQHRRAQRRRQVDPGVEVPVAAHRRFQHE